MRVAEERLGEAAEALETYKSHMLGMDKSSRVTAQTKAKQLASTLESTRATVRRAAQSVERDALLGDTSMSVRAAAARPAAPALLSSAVTRDRRWDLRAARPGRAGARAPGPGARMRRWRR